jgi:TolB-like protein
MACLLCGLWADAQTQEKIRVGVIEFTKTGKGFEEYPEVEHIVTEWLTVALVDSDMLEVVERRELEKILNEQSLGQTGVLDSESAAQAGKILGVDVLVTGTLIMFGEALDITARLIDTTNGTIVGVATVNVEDENELRLQVKQLAESVSQKLIATSDMEQVKFRESFDEPEFNSRRWEYGFDDEFKKADQENTSLTQKDGMLTVTGTYAKQTEERVAWLTLSSGATYYSIEAKIRVRELQGGASVCTGMTWNDGDHWSGLCSYVEPNYSALVILVEADEDKELTFDTHISTNEWGTLRLDFRNEQFYYYWNNQLVKQLKLEENVASSELQPIVALSFDETKTVAVDIDEIVYR